MMMAIVPKGSAAVEPCVHAVVFKKMKHAETTEGKSSALPTMFHTHICPFSFL
jgi:hypothetical protein